MPNEARKVLIHDLCDARDCKKLASYRVVGRNDEREGSFCEHHADEKVELLNLYYQATDREYARKRSRRE